MNLCSLLLEAWKSKLKINLFGFWLSNDCLLHISHIFPFVLVSILFFTLNRSSLCGALASSMYSETATRDISRFHFPSSRHILQLVHSTLVAGSWIQMFYLYSFCKFPVFYQIFFLSPQYMTIWLLLLQSSRLCRLPTWCSSSSLFWFCLQILCHC